MIVQTCDFKTRFLEITNRKERGKYYSDLGSLECFKKGFRKYFNNKVKFQNAGGSTKVTNPFCKRNTQLSEFGRDATSMLRGDEHYT